MKIENNFKLMYDVLTRELSDVKSDLSAGKLESAKDKFDFVKSETKRWADEIRITDGSYQGIARKIFKHPYQVPEDILQRINVLYGQLNKVEGELTKKLEKSRNLQARANAKIKKENKEV
ncbi:hypothetical protein [Lactococcus fujiensis]|nr:hypothetical protein [Lactococcus fujiensis]